MRTGCKEFQTACRLHGGTADCRHSETQGNQGQRSDSQAGLLVQMDHHCGKRMFCTAFRKVRKAA